MAEIIEGIKSRAEKRQAEWKLIKLGELPDPYTLGELSILGSYSYLKLKSRERLVRADCLINLGDGLVATPPQLARDYLSVKYKQGPRIKKYQLIKQAEGLVPAPNYADPTRFDHGYYIDIKSAYWSIMNITGWDLDYNPGEWLAPGEPPADFPWPGHKIARNCLVSSGVPRPIDRYMPPDKFDTIKGNNKLRNFGLYKLILDVLNSIAYEAINLGAVYVNNDGYIAPTERKAAAIIGLILDWGLTPTIKAEGPGAVRGAGSYAVGHIKSIPYKLRPGKNPVENIHRPKYYKWLQDTFSAMVAENTP